MLFINEEKPVATIEAWVSGVSGQSHHALPAAGGDKGPIDDPIRTNNNVEKGKIATRSLVHDAFNLLKNEEKMGTAPGSRPSVKPELESSSSGSS
ncbi:hypothetical protein EVAR_60456_1 [Eumeta japonica]|uniref:Uncharacterized protein n=1 Tax=Eumeta variegata TaxID=151549 RepID=A0A4C1Z0P8_EUMVA|nr:hypothetical protein EVAR_60456_1 [Eumeta japonica]